MTQKQQIDFEQCAKLFEQEHYNKSYITLGKVQFDPNTRAKHQAICLLYEAVMKAHQRKRIDEEKLKEVLETASTLLACEYSSVDYYEKLLAFQKTGTELLKGSEDDRKLGHIACGLFVVLSSLAIAISILTLCIAAPPLVIFPIAACLIVLGLVAQGTYVFKYNPRSEEKRALSNQIAKLYETSYAFYKITPPDSTMNPGLIEQETLKEQATIS